MDFNQMMGQHMLEKELDMLDSVYEGLQLALSREYKQKRTEIHVSYGVEEPKPEPTPEPPAAQALGTDTDIRMDANTATNANDNESVVRRAPVMGAVPGRA